MESRTPEQGNDLVLAYCRRSMAQFDLENSGIFTRSELESQVHSMIGPFPPSAEERSKIFSDAQDRLLAALAAIVGPRLLEIESMKQQISNQMRMLQRERDRRKSMESGSIPSSTQENLSDDTTAMTIDGVTMVVIKHEPTPEVALMEQDEPTPPMEASLIEPEPPVDGKDDSGFVEVASSRKNRKRKRSPFEQFSAKPESIATKDIISRLFAYEGIAAWINPTRSAAPTMVIWFSAPEQLLNYQMHPKRGCKIPFVLVCGMDTSKSTFTPRGVLYPRHMLPAADFVHGVVLPSEVDTEYWGVWKKHPFMSERYKDTSLGDYSFKTPKLFWPDSSLNSKLVKYCDSQLPKNSACACQIVTSTPLPQFKLTHQDVTYDVCIPLEDLRRPNQMFHQFFNLNAAGILVLMLQNPRAIVDRYGTEAKPS
eukprot:TRINITY_DN7042_c0_g1_i1.p1 TRINITY_DN7042_c0_g1~~TRINITY_DN7042_c0_g1_i1.p1  ORF type:complete len:425 (-),score=52.04 TRINITY_DN7042_c0_g1_i1:166-1440(-)